ncbi:NHL repeat- and peptidase C13 NHLdomain-containing protein [Desulfonema limicola]|uniref:NHL repeat- and peptidase C13 NHLdomain-containing protein n=1 Tax=Desulfonema limicola TaxID=45656 RepID=A0A975BAL3_9BACT|nr:SMP-30/gluconolactonase/LRE family protein [Desulfonema limicola]QTA81714.1 NHL repeat- and peptidase C13 NHLdomain-containing protein [Desulfonema limicola]
MRKLYFILFSIFFLMPVFAQGGEIYKFERMWPAVRQPWYFSFPSGISSDDNGYVYIADTWNNLIQKFTADGQFISKWGKQGNGEGEFYQPEGVAVDHDGFVYVSDTWNQRIQKFTPDGKFVSQWKGPDNNEIFMPTGIAADNIGFIYVINSDNRLIYKFTNNGQFIIKWGEKGEPLQKFSGITADSSGLIYVSDTANHRVLKYSPEGELLDQWGKKGGGDGELNLPSGIAVDEKGFVYVTDGNNDRVQKFTNQGEFIVKWGKVGTLDGEMNAPAGITLDKKGFAYVADWGNRRIQKFSINGRFIASWKSHGSEPGDLHLPQDMAVNEEYLFAADKNNHRIQKFTLSGEPVSEWGSRGNQDGQFNLPYGIAVDKDNNIYVADTLNDRIQKFDINGKFILKWGNQGTGNGEFDDPSDIDVDSMGNVYVVDWENHRIQKFDSSGKYLGQWGEYGTGDGQFYRPFGIAVDKDDNIYVTDTYYNCRIQKFNSQGKFLFSWGTCGENTEQFRGFSGIDTDDDGFVYAADSDNNRIQKFDSSGKFITSFGESGSDPGQFKFPKFVCAGTKDRIYVSDTENHRIQVLKKISGTSEISKAVIVAGGGSYPGNHLWDATRLCTGFAYRTLNYQGFTKNDIFYLTEDTELDLDNNGEPDDVDGLPGIETLKTAVTQWAEDADTLIIYLADHGGSGIFRLSSTENLKAEDLDSWLDQVQEKTSAKVIIIYDACNGASLIPALKTAPPGKDRICIVSSSEDEEAYFINQGAVSFSAFFWSHIFNGHNLLDAFDMAKISIKGISDFQNPVMETAGSIDPGTIYPGSGIGLPDQGPVMEGVFDDKTISETDTTDIYVEKVTDDDGIARVWAVIRPPAYAAETSNSPVLELPFADLLPSGKNRYECTYKGFNIPGTYNIAVYARDRKGNVSGPVSRRISVENPSIRRALIAAGGNQADPGWPIIEKNAALAYKALISQGYRDEDIYFISSAGFMPGIDGISDISNMRYAFESWADQNTEDIVIYMAGTSGEPGRFRLNALETLGAELLDTWLDNMQNRISGTVTLVLDTDYAGSFLPLLIPPVNKQRIVIAGTPADQQSLIVSEKSASFSSFFWKNILYGQNVRNAFLNAKNAMGFYPGNSQNQSPLIDDNGNGIGNERADGLLAADFTIGAGIRLSGNDPVIGSVTPDIVLNGETSASISVENVGAAGDVEKVWGIVSLPDKELSNASVLPVINFSPGENNTYKGTYDDFSLFGSYSIALYAEDTQGNTSVFRETRVYQSSGIDIYEPDDTREKSGCIVINSETPQHRNFFQTGDQDWIMFYGVSGKTYTIKAKNQGEKCSAAIELFDGSGALLDSMETPPGENALSWDKKIDQDGFYYIRVKSADDSSGQGTEYDFEIYYPTGPFMGFLKGMILDASTGQPVTMAAVSTGAGAADISRPNGRYMIIQEPGTFSLSIQAPGYEPLLISDMPVSEGGTTIQDIKPKTSAFRLNEILFCQRGLNRDKSH